MEIRKNRSVISTIAAVLSFVSARSARVDAREDSLSASARTSRKQKIEYMFEKIVGKAAKRRYHIII